MYKIVTMQYSLSQTKTIASFVHMQGHRQGQAEGVKAASPGEPMSFSEIDGEEI